LQLKVGPLKHYSEFRECERLQQAIWGGLSVATEVMIVTQKFGGLVLGSFIGKRLVGFTYAFLARREGRIVHWSHMMGVLPEFRDRGLGLQLKLAHRQFALEQNILSICWTYDPLQSRNASLNLTKLGARAEEYLEDCYGMFQSTIEKGLPSDRLVVDWRIASKSVATRLAGGSPPSLSLLFPRINVCTVNRHGFLVNADIDLNRRDSRLLLEIPANTDLMRQESLALAKQWRFQTREMFKRYFSRGYRIDGFVTGGERSGKRCFYVLRRAGQ
jgi:predicted GNAT superfamily acetyltransferase